MFKLGQQSRLVNLVELNLRLSCYLDLGCSLCEVDEASLFDGVVKLPLLFYPSFDLLFLLLEEMHLKR